MKPIKENVQLNTTIPMDLKLTILKEARKERMTAASYTRKLLMDLYEYDIESD